MDPVVILIGVAIVVALYFLYRYLTNNTLVSDVRTLKTVKTNDAEALTNPGSKKFSYQFWLFVATAPSSEGTVFKRGTNFEITLLNNTLSVKWTDSTSTAKTVTITDKMPIQKWTFIVVNVYDSSNILEMFVNGKLMTTVSTSANQFITTKGTGLTIGDGTTDAYITQLIRTPDVIPVDKVWSNYLSGNGQANLSNYLANYDVAMSISKDDMLQRRYQMFG